MSFFDFAQQLWGYTAAFLLNIWPVVLFFILFPLFRSAYLFWRQQLFIEDTKWVFLEMIIPRLLEKSPRGMDQVLQSLHQLRNSPSTWRDRYNGGEVTYWFTLEMVSFGGQIHFYIRCEEHLRPLVEAAFYSAYPDVELNEVHDYMHTLPHTYADIRAQGYEMWGTEMTLKKPSMYPIKSYLDFETPDEQLQFDPISSFLEVLGQVKEKEFLGLQFNIIPHDHESWIKHFEADIDKLREPRKIESDKEGGFPMMIPKSKRQSDILDAVERNFSKPPFACAVRFVYMGPKADFYDSFARRGIISAFNQYSAGDLNAFGQNFGMMTGASPYKFPYLFTGIRKKLRKQRLWGYYHHREAGIETFFGKLISSHPLNFNFHSTEFELNTESLATLFHPPTGIVLTAPHTKRVESKKFGAPAGLPIYADEKVLDKFL